MIKFFRNIRQNLLVEGQTAKYLKYASGEILLVVLGILIALQINNWNEERKNQLTRSNYYEQIIRDLNSDIRYSTTKKMELDSSILIYDQYNAKSQADLDISDMLNEIERNDLFIHRVNFQPDIINSLITTGDIKLFNSEFQERLTSYQAYRKHISENIQQNIEIGNPPLTQAFMIGYNSNLRNRIKGNRKLINALKIKENEAEIILLLEAYLTFKVFTERGASNTLSRVINDANEIIELIQKEGVP